MLDFSRHVQRYRSVHIVHVQCRWYSPIKTAEEDAAHSCCARDFAPFFRSSQKQIQRCPAASVQRACHSPQPRRISFSCSFRSLPDLWRVHQDQLVVHKMKESTAHVHLHLCVSPSRGDDIDVKKEWG